MRVWNKSELALVFETGSNVPPPYSLHQNPDGSLGFNEAEQKKENWSHWNKACSTGNMKPTR